jgi:hypothetical protein
MTTDTHICPTCTPREFLLAVQRVANVVEDMGLSEQDIIDRVNYIMEGVRNDRLPR